MEAELAKAIWQIAIEKSASNGKSSIRRLLSADHKLDRINGWQSSMAQKPEIRLEEHRVASLAASAA